MKAVKKNEMSPALFLSPFFCLFCPFLQAVGSQLPKEKFCSPSALWSVVVCKGF